MQKTKKYKIPLTPVEICGLRLKCTEVFVPVASKLALETGSAQRFGQKLWDECVETIYQNENGGLTVNVADPDTSNVEPPKPS